MSFAFFFFFSEHHDYFSYFPNSSSSRTCWRTTREKGSEQQNYSHGDGENGERREKRVRDGDKLHE